MARMITINRLKWAGLMLAGAILVSAVSYPWFMMGQYRAHMMAQYAVMDASAKKNATLSNSLGECVRQLTRFYDGQ